MSKRVFEGASENPIFCVLDTKCIDVGLFLIKVSASGAVNGESRKLTLDTLFDTTCALPELSSSFDMS